MSIDEEPDAAANTACSSVQPSSPLNSRLTWNSLGQARRSAISGASTFSARLSKGTKKQKLVGPTRSAGAHGAYGFCRRRGRVLGLEFGLLGRGRRRRRPWQFLGRLFPRQV